MTRIAVIGAGYVGLTTAAGMAHLGHDVVGADIDVERVAALERGEVPILEAGLGELLAESRDDGPGSLRFVVGASAAVTDAEVVFLCVPTPPSGDGSADLSAVHAVMDEIGTALLPGTVLVTKSTVPVGTTRALQDHLGRDDVSFVSNPEFLREGCAVEDFLHPERVVVGADDAAAGALVASLYEGTGSPVLITDPASSESIKYATNSFLAMKVTFVNSLAAFCELVDADVREVARGLGMDQRVGSRFLQPGPGFGGSCFPKDVQALLARSGQLGYDFPLLREVLRVNVEQFDRVAAKAERLAGGSVAQRRVAVWGLTFKANTDDRRESPALHVIERLVAAGADVVAYDPAVDAGTDVGEGVTVVEDPYAACDGAAVLVVLTEWEEFTRLDPVKIAEMLDGAAVVDGRNLLDHGALRAAGLQVEGIGTR